MRPPKIHFGSFVLDIANRTLANAGVPVELKTKAVDVLCALALAEGRLVSKEELMAKVWPGLVVEEGNIQVHVSALRKAFGEERGRPNHLLTVARRGYRLSGTSLSNEDPSRDQTIAPTAGPSVAVLAFENLSSDREQEYFADGIVEDIIAGLARIKWLSVIGRNSSFVYKGQRVDLKQIGRELNVQYAVQGSVRSTSDRVLIAAQLIETGTGRQVWGARYDRPLVGIFELQDEIAMSVVGAIEPGLRDVEIARAARRMTENMSAYDLVLRALPHTFKLMPASSAPAIPLLERALLLDPAYAAAHAYLAWCLHVRFSRGGSNPDDRREAIRHARAALAGASGDATTLAIAAFVIWFQQHDLPTAFELFDQALAVSKSNVLALCTSAVALAWSGQSELAMERAQRALALSPFDSLNYLSYQAMAGANFHLKRFDEACHTAKRAVDFNPDFSVPYAYLAAALVRLDRLGEAREALSALLALQPSFTISTFRETVGVELAVFSPFADAWRKAGMPE